MNPNPILTSYLKHISISSHPRLDLSSGLFPSGFPTKIFYAFLSLPCVLHAPPHLILLDFMTLIIFDEDKLGCNI
jgi:hypothetical protein